ncbi:MAG: DUF1080 domain-containing protein [Planctomycetia bacterium]|nr:DUF1080 domain-containing protein [Planctomycetia bacterium]
MMLPLYHRRRVSTSVLLGAMLASIIGAAGANRCVAAEGWIELFDGKTLAGWHKNADKIGHGTGGQWTVEGGAITGQQDPPGSGNGGILLTDRKFKDFELEIDLKPDWGICSGLFLRSNETGKCLQMMVDYHDAGDVGHVYGEGTGGFNTRAFNINGVVDAAKNLTSITTKPVATPVKVDYTCTGDEWTKAWKINDWNSARVRVEGSPAKVTTWLNGVKIIEWDGKTYEGPGYDKAKVIDTIGDEGSIAVQVHGGKSWPVGAKCRWKNIRIKPL